MKNILFRINELAKKEKTFRINSDEKQEQQMLSQNYTKDIPRKLRFHFTKYNNC